MFDHVLPDDISVFLLAGIICVLSCLVSHNSFFFKIARKRLCTPVVQIQNLNYSGSFTAQTSTVAERRSGLPVPRKAGRAVC